MGILEAIKKGFGIAGKNMLLILVLFIFNLIWNVINVAIMPAGALPTPGAVAATPPAIPPQAALNAFFFSALFILISIFMQGGSLGLVRDYIKEGKMKLSQFASYGLKYYLRLIGTGLVMILFMTIVALVAFLIIFATSPLNNVIVTALASVIAIAIGLVGIYWFFLLIMSPYCVIVSDIDIKRKIQFIAGVVLSIILSISGAIIIQTNTIAGAVSFIAAMVSIIYSGIIAFLDMKKAFSNSVEFIASRLFFKYNSAKFAIHLSLSIITAVIILLIGGLVLKVLSINDPQQLVAYWIFLIFIATIYLLTIVWGRAYLLLLSLILIAIGIGVLLGILAGLLTVALPQKPGQMVIGVVNSIFNGYFGIVMMAAFMAFYLAVAGKDKAAV